MLESIEKSPTRYKFTIRHFVFKGVSFQSALHFMKRCKGFLQEPFPMDGHHPHIPARAPQETDCTWSCPVSLGKRQSQLQNALVLSISFLSSLPPGMARPNLFLWMQDCSGVWIWHEPNTSPYQTLNEPPSQCVQTPLHPGRETTRDHWENPTSPRTVGNGCRAAFRGGQGPVPKRNDRDGARPGAAVTVWRPSVWLLPGFSELIKGKRIWSRQRDAFTTTDSNGNIRQFVLRCYCTFPVLITNYDSITPAWQFICSCLCSGRLGVGPLISRFHSSERSARRLSSAGAEDGRHRQGSDNCTWPYNNLLRKYLLNSGMSPASLTLTAALQISDNGINLWPARQTLH